MDYISQQDLDVRMQLTGCKFGQLTNEFADNLKYGRKCIVENQRNLVLLNAYLELLECYKVALINRPNNSPNKVIEFLMRILGMHGIY